MSHGPASLSDTVDPHETLSRDEAHGAHVHVTPFWPMLWVFVILLALTALTVWSSNIHHFWIGNTLIEVGPTPHILLAMAIAIVKSLLVAAYFMHLKYDNPMNSAVVAATIFAVILFIGLTLGDMASRNIMDPLQHRKIMLGGTSHRGPDGTWVTGKNTVDAARENAKAHATNPSAHGSAPAAEPAKPASGGH